MKRREFLRTTSAVCAGMAITKAMPMLADTAAANGWKTFEVTRARRGTEACRGDAYLVTGGADSRHDLPEDAGEQVRRRGWSGEPHQERRGRVGHCLGNVSGRSEASVDANQRGFDQKLR